MRPINLEKLTNKDLLDHAAISKEFKIYLMETLEYDEYEADFVIASDFATPYDTPFIMQDYEGQFVVDGKAYEVRLCHTDFSACGMFHLTELPPFEFYMFFDLDTMPDTTVGSYRKAKTLYLL